MCVCSGGREKLLGGIADWVVVLLAKHVAKLSIPNKIYENLSYVFASVGSRKCHFS